jgi:uncharacterized protein (TIGR02594 family)
MTKYNRAILDAAGEYLGLVEWPGAKHNPAVLQMFDDVGHSWVNDDETPWCAAFVGSVLASLGLPHTGKLNAKSYLEYGTDVDLSQAVPGDIVVLWRGSRAAATGHVAFFVGIDGNKIILRGGNQDNRVTDDPYDLDRVLEVRRADGRAAEPTRPTLRYGGKGAFVLDLQDQLERLGYPLGKVDGHFGSRTEEAVVAFQRVNGLTVDGIAGPATWAALTKAPNRPLRDVTAEDLKGSRTIQAADRVSTAAGATVGVAGAGTAWEAFQYVQQLGDVEGLLGTADKLVRTYWPALLVVALAFVIWHYAKQIKAARIDDAITGRNLGR